VAFLLTMVPATLGVRIALPLMLPLLSGEGVSTRRRNERFTLMFEVSVVAAALYLAGFLMLGGPAVRMAFGHNYAGYGGVTGALALMWALRLLQSPFGALHMTAGDNRPLLVAGIVRALALGPTLWAAHSGMSLATLGICGAGGELGSLLYLALLLRRTDVQLCRMVLTRTSFLGVTLALTLPFWMGSWANLDLPTIIALAILVATAVVAAAVAIMPSTRMELRGLRRAAA